ncbi:MAG: DUF1835 domain-containing protein [Acidobacteriota bacterium]
MILNVLPGDATLGAFMDSGIEGEIAVCRECLVVGDLSGSTLPEFWENRARFLAGEYPDASGDYHETVVREFAKLAAPGSDSQINLWFEYDLFCQTNMWFCLSLLAESTADIFRVAPVKLSDENVWEGFGALTPHDLKECFDSRVKLSPDDIRLGSDLWSAYRINDHLQLEALSMIESPAFPKLREVCAAAPEKEAGARKIVGEIISNGVSEFDEVFRNFKARAGVYGYGDAQVKKIWQGLLV